MENQKLLRCTSCSVCIFYAFLSILLFDIFLLSPGRRVNTLNSSFSSCASALGIFFSPLFIWTTHEHYYLLFSYIICNNLFAVDFSVFYYFVWFSTVNHVDWRVNETFDCILRRKKNGEFSRALCMHNVETRLEMKSVRLCKGFSAEIST